MSNQDYNEKSIDAVLARMEERLERIEGFMSSTINSHNERIVALEHKVWWASGAAAIIGFVLPFVFKLL